MSVEERPHFEEAFRRLEETVQQLEAGGLSLDESIDRYEEATALAALCQELLDAAELRLRRLQEAAPEAPAASSSAGNGTQGLAARLETSPGSLVPCPHCSQPIPPESAICLYCGKTVAQR